MTNDLTQGRPLPLLLRFTVPLALGALFQQCFAMVDSIIVGKFIGVDALAAVGSTGSLNFLIIGLVTGSCCGMGIPISQCFGARDWANLRRYVFNAAYVCMLLTAVLTTVTALFTRQFLVWMRTPDNIIDGAYSYISTVFYGLGGIFLYQMSAAVIRALGDSRTPVFFLVLACLINAVLDLVFVIVFRMGVFGAALATVISQLVSGLACFFYILRSLYILRPARGEARPSARHIGSLFAVGVPMGLQYTVTAIGSVVIQSAINTLGSTAVAAITAAGKVSIFFTCPMESLGTAMATYTGQNLGARRYDRIRTGMVQTVLIGAVYSLLAALALKFAAPVLVQLFVDAAETQVIAYAAQYLAWNSYFYIPLTLIFLYRFSLQGLGYSGFAMLAGVTEMIARSAVAFAAVPALGFFGACLSNPLAWVSGAAFLVPAFYARLKKRIAILQAEPAAAPAAPEE